MLGHISRAATGLNITEALRMGVIPTRGKAYSKEAMLIIIAIASRKKISLSELRDALRGL